MKFSPGPSIEQESQTNSRFGLNSFRALRHKNYRFFFFGQGISLIGTWMQNVATSWLVYRLTGSSLALGLLTFTTHISVFFITPLAGVFSDRWDRRRLLIIAQFMLMLQALLLSFLVLSDSIATYHVFFLCFILGMITGFDMPVRQAFVVQMVDDSKDIGNAIALNSALFNSARLIGPSIAGILIATLGEGYLFLLNGISYIAVIISLFLMKLNPRIQRNSNNLFFSELKEGITYTLKHKLIRYLLIHLVLVSLLGSAHTVLMPVFAANVLNGGPKTLGFLIGSIGIGALLGTIHLASKKTVFQLGRLMLNSAIITGGSLLLFSYSSIILLSEFLLVLVGFGLVTQIASCNTLIQTVVEEDKRGRVMSFYIMALVGALPIGGLITGLMSSFINAQLTVAIMGICFCFVAYIFRQNLPSLMRLSN
jgi:MFS family permease